MKRLEVMANNSVQEEIINSLEKNITDFYYTLVPVVHGRGRQEYKMGTAIWPEENFLLISYIDDTYAELAIQLIGEVKKDFSGEGIKAFLINAEAK